MVAEAGVPVSGSAAKTRSRAAIRGRPVIIVALDAERRTAAPLLAASAPTRFEILQSGPGPSAAASAAERAADGGATALISWGLAGGLAEPALPGSLLVPDRVIASDGSVFSADAGWRDAVLAAQPEARSPAGTSLVSADRVLETPEQKRALALESGAIAADMESAAIAAVADKAGLPFLAIRAVADGPDDRLPPGVESWVTPEGSTRYRAVLAALLEPGNLGLIVILARRSGAATAALRGLARSLAARDPLAAVAGVATSPREKSQ